MSCEKPRRLKSSLGKREKRIKRAKEVEEVTVQMEIGGEIKLQL